MNTAITALDKIYSEILVHECSGESLTRFKENLNKMKRDWSRVSRIEEFTEILRNGGLEEWRRLHKEAHRDFERTGMGSSMNTEIPYNHDFTLLQEAWVKFDQEEKKKAYAETLARSEVERQKAKEDELLVEARRRLAAAKREQAIQALMASLTDEKA